MCQFFVIIFPMLLRTRPTTRLATTAATLLLLLTACQQPQPAAPRPPLKVTYSETYDREIKQIMDLANQNRWEEAQAKADALYLKDPTNAILARVHSWVAQQAQLRRAQAVEDKIRSIDAKNSVFNPNPRAC
jgi:hypothetical protein